MSKTKPSGNTVRVRPVKQQEPVAKVEEAGEVGLDEELARLMQTVPEAESAPVVEEVVDNQPEHQDSEETVVDTQEQEVNKDDYESESVADATFDSIQASLMSLGTKVEERIPSFNIPDEGGGDVIMLYKPERCLTCSYLVGDLVINGVATQAHDKCHHEYAVKDGEQVGNPNCPAQSIRLVKGANFERMASRLRKATETKDAAKLAKIYAELAELDPSVSTQIIALAK